VSDDTADPRAEFEEQAQAEPIDLEGAVGALAKLKALEYDRAREAEAKRLGVRVSTLDAEVRKLRGDAQPTEEVGGSPLDFEVPEPWETVDGAELLVELARLFARHVVLPEGAATAIALWVAGAWAFDAWRTFPKLALVSPVRRCGKTTALETLAGVVPRPLVASGVSPAAFFRVVEAHRPSLLLDEADAWAQDNEELTGVLNAGHSKRSAFVLRTVPAGDDFEVRAFSVWAPTVLAAIGELPSTVMDRSVVVPLRRKAPGERAEGLPLDFEEGQADTRRRLARWALDHVEALRYASPILPTHANDRATRQNWHPLIAIAESAGDDWRERAHKAFHALTPHDGDDSLGVLLLGDVRDTFETRGADRLHSTDLVAALVALTERPWPEHRRGKPLTENGLARLLKPFKVHSKQVRVGAVSKKGYELADFADAFARYLPRDPPSEPKQRNNVGGEQVSEEFRNETPSDPVSVEKLPKPNSGAGCFGVSVEKGEAQGGNGSDPDPTWFGSLPDGLDLPEVIDL